MKFYMIMTVDFSKEESPHITWKRKIFLSRDEAFQEAIQIGPIACVLELMQSDSWNLEQMQSLT
jgi:hypothetical protein